MSRHPCSVADCGKLVDVELLMCVRHWYLVPHALRKRVWAAYHGWKAGRVSIEHLREVQAEATAAVELRVKGGVR